MNLSELVDTTAHEETRRIMQICNACRYCEEFCAVFPAMERRRTFDVGDTAYLANLCHNCGSCFHSCQYAPLHEFAINVPQTLSERRTQSYEDYAWPPTVSRIFRYNGFIVTLIVCLVLSACVGAMLALISPHLFWGIHLGEGAFYVLVPHSVMAGIPLAISSFVIVSFIMGAGGVTGSKQVHNGVVLPVLLMRYAPLRPCVILAAIMPEQMKDIRALMTDQLMLENIITI